MRSLEGKVAIVTGGAQGIGRAYCLAFADEGASVVVADMNDTSTVEKELAALGAPVLGVRVDVAEAGSTEAMAEATADQFGKIDVLVNNAGFFKKATVGPFSDITLEEWDLAFAVNVRGSWLCARAVYPYMKARKYGKIINISSTTCWKGVPGFLHYVSSKSAIIGFTRSLAREVGDDGIRVNTLVPDLIPDDEITARQPAANDLAISQRCLKRTQVPEDMVGAAVFLAGEGSDFLTGQSVHVNGGIYFS